MLSQKCSLGTAYNVICVVVHDVKSEGVSARAFESEFSDNLTCANKPC